MTSSPDPLGFSDENATTPLSPSKARASIHTSRTPLKEVLGNSAVQDFYIPSPTPIKKRTLSNNGKALSPWRIRVTLQAEPIGDAQENSVLDDKTIVTRIPLKGGDDSSPPEMTRGRERPLKSLGSPSKRPGTPKPNTRRARSASAPTEVEEEQEHLGWQDMSPFAKRGDAFPKRRARRSRSPRKQEDQAMPLTPTLLANENDLAAESKRKRSRSRKRRTEITPRKLLGNGNDMNIAYQNSPTAVPEAQEHMSSADEAVNLEDDAQALSNDEEARTNSIASNQALLPLHDTDVVEQAAMPDDATSQHEEFDTILESEGFSMVSVDSLSSRGGLSSSPTEANEVSEPDVSADLGSSVVGHANSKDDDSVHGYSDISSFVPAAASPTKYSHLPPSKDESVHGYSDISSFIPPIASPTKTSHLPFEKEESVHGYSDISSFIPAAASPTKTSHLPVHMMAKSPKRAHNYSKIACMPDGTPFSDRVSQLRPKSTKRALTTSPSTSPSMSISADVSPLPSKQPSYLNGTRQVSLALRTPPVDSLSPSTPAAPVAVQGSPSSRPPHHVREGSPKLGRTQSAGSALQSLHSPGERTIQYSDRLGSPFQVYNKLSPSCEETQSGVKCKDSSQAVSKSCHMVQADKVFDCSDAATGRELKASSRFNEHLARRKSQDAPSSSPTGDVTNGSLIGTVQAAGTPMAPKPKLGTGTYRSPVVENSQQVEIAYPNFMATQLPSPAASIPDGEEAHLSQKANTPIQPMDTMVSSGLSSRKGTAVSGDSLADSATIAKEAEWQREREAVSRTIEMANTSKVIVIDSDGSDQGQVSDDEVNSSIASTSVYENPHARLDSSTQPFDLRVRPEVIKSRRNKLPSPWRRSSQIYGARQTPDATEADLFWQPEESKAAERRKHRRKQTTMSPVETTTSDQKTRDYAKEKSTLQVSENESVALSETSEDQDSLQEHRPQLNREALPRLRPVQKIVVSRSPESDTPRYLEESLATPCSYRSDDVTQDNLKDQGKPLSNEISTASCVEATDVIDNWSTQGLTLVDPELRPERHVFAGGNNQNIAVEASDISSAINKTASATSLAESTEQRSIESSTITSPTPPASASWLATITNLFTQAPPPEMPWYNSPTCGLPPATRSDILASSPFVAISATTPWTKAHQAALIPLYQSSWLFGTHIFAPSSPATSSAARHISHTFTTPLGWSRVVTAQDASIADAFMILLTARSKGFISNTQNNNDNKDKDNNRDSSQEHQYNIPRNTPITEELVLRKCIEIWQDMIICGDIPPPSPTPCNPTPSHPPHHQPQSPPKEEEEKNAGTIGLRRRGDRLWRSGSWWDMETERSQRAYFDRKRLDWGGLPSWRGKGLV